MKTPILIPLDMSLAEKHHHPNISIKKEYLCCIDHKFYAGTFHKTWFGLSFWGWNGVSYQFDAPGWNSSRWIQIWEIKSDD